MDHCIKRLGSDVIPTALASPELLVLLEIPEFRASTSFDLFETLGLNDELSEYTDFAGISEKKLKLQSTIQAAKLEVTEAGIRASSVTYSTATVSGVEGMINPDREFIVDRPFLFLVVHVPTQTPLFSSWAGRVRDSRRQ